MEKLDGIENEANLQTEELLNGQEAAPKESNLGRQRSMKSTAESESKKRLSSKGQRQSELKKATSRLSKDDEEQKDGQEAAEGEEGSKEAEDIAITKEEAEKDGEAEEEEKQEIVEEMEQEEVTPASGFEAIRYHYEQVLQTFRETEGIEQLTSEYTRIFEEVETYNYKVEQLEQEKAYLEKEVEKNIMQLGMAATESNALQQTINAQLSQMEALKRQLDASHDRERALQELTESLKNQIDEMDRQLQLINKMSKEQEEDLGSRKKKNALQRDKERLENEVTILSDRLKLANAIKDELEERIAAIEANNNELNQTIEIQNQYLLKEQQMREGTEKQLATVNTAIKLKVEDIDHLQKELNIFSDNYSNSEKNNKQLKKMIERYDTDRENLKVSNMKLSEVIEEQKENIKLLKTNIAQKNEELVAKEGQYTKLNTENMKIVKAREASDKRAHLLEVQNNQQESEKSKLKLAIENLHNEVQKMKRDREDDHQTLDAVTKNRDYLKKNVTHLQTQITQLERQLLMTESNKIKIEGELKDLVQTNNKVCQKLAGTEKERDRHAATIIELTDKLEDASDNIKDKLANIYELKKSIFELTTKLRMQQNVFEVIRGERNTFEKLLIQSQDTAEELKGKVKLINSQVDQLKEQIALKEAQLLKEQKALSKCKKDKEELRVELQNSQVELSRKKEEIKQLVKDNKNILRMNAILESEKTKLTIQINQIMNERDILGTQLVRRNDEISLLYEKIKVMQVSFRRGEIQYNQRLEDIRLLKLEIKRLLQEKKLLAKHIRSVVDNRTAVLDLERNYVKANLKVQALEEEVTSPFNIHRWRKLEGEDPNKLELIKKVIGMQKRMMRYGYRALEREEQMQEMMRVYNEIQGTLIHMPSPDTTVHLAATQRALQKRGKQMKCLVSELGMYEFRESEIQYELKKVKSELYQTKTELFKLKLEKDKKRFQSKEKTYGHTQSCERKRILGGGFNMEVISSTAI